MKSKSKIGSRIRSERERLAMTQTEFAKAVGVGRMSNIHYELGDRVPNVEVLLKMREIGVDIWFVLTGELQEDAIDQQIMENSVDLLLKMVFEVKAKPDAKVLTDVLLHFYRSMRLQSKLDQVTMTAARDPIGEVDD